MNDSQKNLTIGEAKSKDLVPLVKGQPLHSLYNPRREAEVFANNHLAQLSRTPNVLVLGLGFGYHLEEISKILRLKHKHYRMVVIEAYPELVKLWRSYQKITVSADIYTADEVPELYQDLNLCKFLLEKPVVIIHHPSFQAARAFYEQFLKRRAETDISSWTTGNSNWDQWCMDHHGHSANEALNLPPGQYSNWIKAFWEFKHAE